MDDVVIRGWCGLTQQAFRSGMLDDAQACNDGKKQRDDAGCEEVPFVVHCTAEKCADHVFVCKLFFALRVCQVCKRCGNERWTKKNFLLFFFDDVSLFVRGVLFGGGGDAGGSYDGCTDCVY